MIPSRLDAVPSELLEHIAFFVFDPFSHTPFADLHALALCNRSFAQQLRSSRNPLLYARLFRAAFDCDALQRRNGFDDVAPDVIAGELRRRFAAMWRFQREPQENDLWTVLLMLLEDDGRNVALLELHANIKQAASARLDTVTATHALRVLHTNAQEWPAYTREIGLLLWIIWMVSPGDRHLTSGLLAILTPFVLGTHRYSLSNIPWADRNATPTCQTILSYFGTNLRLADPEFVPVAIIMYLLRILGEDLPSMLLSSTSSAWDGDYARMTGEGAGYGVATRVAGVWEGAFIFTEFRDYIALLRGAPPRALLHAHVGQHSQIWVLRAYTARPADALPAGNAIHAHLPAGAMLREMPGGILKVMLGDSTWMYRAAEDSSMTPEDDVLIAGEGHSSWGQFLLRGRVRPVDGLITLLKQYEANRGLWLYRGFVVGGRDGYFVGRWRDVESPVEQHGYEGCFVLGRRRE